MKSRLVIILAFSALTLVALSSAIERDSVSNLHSPGEQRPLIGELRLPQVNAEEEAALTVQTERATAFASTKRLLSLLSILSIPVIGILFITLKISKRLYRVLKQNHAWNSIVTSYLLGLSVFVAMLPIQIARILLEDNYGLITGDFWEVLANDIFSRFLIIFVAVTTLAILYLVMSKISRMWWVVTVLLIVIVGICVTVLYPLRLPLTGVSATAVSEGPAVEQARMITERSDGESLKLYQDDGYYSDMIFARSSFFSPEILISKGAINTLTPFELEVLIAEADAGRTLGNYSKISLFITILLFIVFYATDALLPAICRRLKTPPHPDSRSIPIIVTVVALGIISAAPFANAYNRFLESEAEELAITITRKPITAIDLYSKQSLSNLSIVEPNNLLHLLTDPHRTTADKIAQARAQREELAR